MVGDYYKTLDINRNATDADIKKAYRRLALKFHPSSNRETGSTETFCQLGEAYDVLSDPRKKATYDKFGEDGLTGGIPPEFGSSGAWSSKYVYHGKPEKTFRDFFGGDNPFADFLTNDTPLQFGGLQPGAVKTQGPQIERDLHLSLDDLFHGCSKHIKISHRVMNEDGHTSGIKDKILAINVKPGWKEGTRIIFPKEGDQGPNCIPGDIVFIVRQTSHSLFVRQHNDLIYKAQITLQMALIGFSVDVQTLDGRLISIPVNDIVHPSYHKVVTGEGMPLSQDPERRGNLIITFDIQFPKKLSADRKYLIKHALTFK
ncbi:dnaJ homolog subfamily B member 13 [Pseudoliparis swirei]|uniref:dnaJ homolog subfamily B member 13 n=1 Tax=Pseudoliparis swirei TaxID=2059687 RepID=UPI0024BDE913|nr:dnaJ homolog subfamily B member 13 [Pseudoliparis swirei]